MLWEMALIDMSPISLQIQRGREVVTHFSLMQQKYICCIKEMCVLYTYTIYIRTYVAIWKNGFHFNATNRNVCMHYSFMESVWILCGVIIIYKLTNNLCGYIYISFTDIYNNLQSTFLVTKMIKSRQLHIYSFILYSIVVVSEKNTWHKIKIYYVLLKSFWWNVYTFNLFLS